MKTVQPEINLLPCLQVGADATLMDVWAVYKVVRPLKPSTSADYEKRLPYMPELAAIPVRRITKARLLMEYHRLKGTGKLRTANYCLQIVRALLHFAMHALELKDGSPLIEYNAAKIIAVTRSWAPTQRRTDYLLPSQLPAWLAAVQKHSNQTESDWLLFLLFTGCRRNEATQLEWRCVDLVNRLVSFEATKNGLTHTIPLPAFLVAILARRQATATSNYVFPGTGPSGRLSKWSKVNRKLAAQTGIAFTPHSLRRTFATTADRVGLPMPIVGALLNHKSSNVTAGYIQRNPETLRPAIETIAAELLRQGEQLSPEQSQ